MDTAQKPSDEDLITIWAFVFKVQDHRSDKTFERFQLVFPSVSLPSAHQSCHRIKFLAGFKTVLYDCCPNSWMCYSGPHQVLDRCLYCREPRCNEDGKARQEFKYTPFIPHLQAAQANKTHAHLMRYRAHEHNHTPGKMSDVFDSSHYCDLLQRSQPMAMNARLNLRFIIQIILAPTTNTVVINGIHVQLHPPS